MKPLPNMTVDKKLLKTVYNIVRVHQQSATEGYSYSANRAPCRERVVYIVFTNRVLQKVTVTRLIELLAVNESCT